MSADVLDATTLRRWAHAAVEALSAHADEINRLNVFPVADADTGTNMLFTVRAAAAHADGAGGGVAEVTAALSAGALQGARGNSGVILSQIFRGMAEVTARAAAERGGDLAAIDGALFAAALRHGVGLVVASVGEVVPGTITSVLQAAADTAEDTAGDHIGLADVVAAAAEAACDALDRTREQLDVLTRAGVVDAGGRGLVALLDALSVALTGHAPHRRRYEAAAVAPSAGPASAPQFEVMYLLDECDHAAVHTLRARLERLGDSIVIAASGGGVAAAASSGGVAPAASGGVAQRFSVHVHADDAGAAVEAALDLGRPSAIQITALTVAPEPDPAARRRAVLAVVDGDGARELFAGEGAAVLPVGADAPVRAHHLLRALVDSGAGQVMVLPNGYVAAEELVAGCTAATARGIEVVPVPAASMVQGLAALAVHDAERAAVDDGYTMARAAAGARHGSVRLATEDALTWAGACTPGDGLGISADEVLIVGPDVVAAGAGLIDLLLMSGGELVTVLTGRDVAPEVGEALRAHVHREHLGAELVTYHTGHRGDLLLIGVE
ncbi:DAK2 domain-containing protein [Mycolicibacterium grossiae]|uniref:Dihydroxyacetone kinase n=1 Tax=Mycolicibacterium grossiae TaxID=1552759 RepID=A0A1E8Q906_9MYCO|nr:DAK2 domain-containing protein [Mycolicibacterium grossiae]OFJ54711.1 dihydroxyacetone kinase [Mycolicibacterium grossiae]QEM46040.1 DAK2 domain-containing protein [Mycolicibacterium grossiae]